MFSCFVLFERTKTRKEEKKEKYYDQVRSFFSLFYDVLVYSSFYRMHRIYKEKKENSETYKGKNICFS